MGNMAREIMLKDKGSNMASQSQEKKCQRKIARGVTWQGNYKRK